MTKNQVDGIISFILAMTFLLMSFIAFTSGHTFGSIPAGLGWIYFTVDAYIDLTKQKYDRSGKPV